MTFAITTIALALAAITSPRELIDRITTADYSATADFAVTMPQLPDDVVYTLNISQSSAPTDTLCPAAYLVDWTITSRPGMEEPGPADKGFNAYFDGNFYSLMAERIRERHAADDPTAFARPSRGGVAVTSQFADLVPAFMADKLRGMLADDRYTVTAIADTIVEGEPAVAILTRFITGGSTGSEGEYIFYPGETLTPRRVTLENNTGSIGEQTITAKFARPQNSAASPAPTDEDALIALYPDEFERFRTSDYRLETLPGRHLPAIAAPTASGGRYARTASEGLRAPTALVLLDARSEFTPEVIAAVRDGASQLPWAVDIIWAFTNTNPDHVAEVIHPDVNGETILTAAKAVARDCGASSTLPAIVFVRPDGIVADILAGYNQSLSSDVVKKMMGINP